MPDFSTWSCPLPLRDYPAIVMGHGGGGKLSSELIEHLFLPAFRNETLENLGDASVVERPAGRIAMSTDSFVVRPLFFPGGSIGDLAVNGTVNDLAMSGARPLYLSAAFILEEGFPIADLGSIVERMAAAARVAGVEIITGDTKVVGRGHGDGLVHINTGRNRRRSRWPEHRPRARPRRRCDSGQRHHRRSRHGDHAASARGWSSSRRS